MTSEITPQAAATYVKMIWEEVTEGVDVNGKLVFKSGEATIQAIITATQKAYPDCQDLDKLQALFTKALESKDRTARTAIAGLANALKTAGILGKGKPECKKAREVGQAAYATLLQGTLRGWITNLRAMISKELLESNILPYEYKTALQNVSATLGENTSPVVIRSLALQLKKEAAEAAPSRKPFLEFLDKLLSFLEYLIDVEKAVDVDLQIKGLMKSVQELKQPLNIRQLSIQAQRLNKKGLIASALFQELRIAQAKSLFKTNQSEAIKILTSIQRNFSRTLRDSINTLQSNPGGFDALCDKLQSELIRIGQTVDHELPLKILSRKPEDGKLTLTEEESRVMLKFLRYAYANPKLNESLRDKEPKTEAEEAICAFTWVTLQQKDNCLNEVASVKAVLEKTGLQEFRDLCRMDDVGNDDEKSLNHYFRIGKEAYEGSFVASLEDVKKNMSPKEFSEIDLLLKNMTFSPLHAKTEEQFSPEHRACVKKMKDKLSKLKEQTLSQKQAAQKAFNAVKLPRKKKAKNYDVIFSEKKALGEDWKKKSDVDFYLGQALAEIEKYSQLLEKGVHLREKLEKDAEKATGSIKLGTIRTLEQFTLSNQLFSILPQDIIEDETIKPLVESGEKAEEVLCSLDGLIQAFPTYQTGDINLDDEVMLKLFKGRPGEIYSTKGVCEHPGELLRTLLDKGPFAVQPAITGRRTHAGIFIIRPDSSESPTPVIKREEMVSDYEEGFPSFKDALTTVTYRPDYEKLVSDNAKKTLQNLYGKDYNKHLSDLFAKHFQKYIEENSEKFASYQNDPFHAAKAWAQNLNPIVRVVVTSILSSLQTRQAQELSPEDQQKLATSTKVFCSEFVAKVMQEVQAKVEQDLQEQLETKKIALQGPILTTMTSLQPSAIDPNKLEEIVFPYAKKQKQPAPVAVRLLFGSDFGPETIAAKA